MYERSMRTVAENRLQWIKDRMSGPADVAGLKETLAEIEKLLRSRSDFLGKGSSKSLEKQRQMLQKKLDRSGAVDFTKELGMLEPLVRWMQTEPDFNRPKRSRIVHKEGAAKKRGRRSKKSE